MQLDDAITQRKSVREFLSTPVPLDLVESILERANKAPSGTNVQPWHVHVVMGAKRDELVAEILAHRENSPTDTVSEFEGASKRKEPYTGRMRTLGKAMYTLLEIPKGDKAANWHQWGRNYEFFGAPVGLIFTIDKDLGPMSFLDIGMFMQNIMLLAVEEGLATCPQESWSAFHGTVAKFIGLPDDQMFYCGMAVGYADMGHPVNQWRTERAPLEEIAEFLVDN